MCKVSLKCDPSGKRQVTRHMEKNSRRGDEGVNKTWEEIRRLDKAAWKKFVGTLCSTMGKKRMNPLTNILYPAG